MRSLCDCVTVPTVKMQLPYAVGFRLTKTIFDNYECKMFENMVTTKVTVSSLKCLFLLNENHSKTKHLITKL